MKSAKEITKKDWYILIWLIIVFYGFGLMTGLILGYIWF